VHLGAIEFDDPRYADRFKDFPMPRPFREVLGMIPAELRRRPGKIGVPKVVTAWRIGFFPPPPLTADTVLEQDRQYPEGFKAHCGGLPSVIRSTGPCCPVVRLLLASRSRRWVARAAKGPRCQADRTRRSPNTTDQRGPGPAAGAAIRSLVR
jgi:hypothetical protein